MVNGVDVSEFQGPIDWAKAKPHVGFAYARATYGAHYADPQFQRNHDECRNLNIPFGAYHFYVFGQDPYQQAEAFLAAADGRLGTLLPMVDVESGAANAQDLAAFIQAVEKELKGKRMLIYTDPGYWNGTGMADSFSGHPLWVANWEVNEPALPTGWDTWVIWQYADNGQIDGIGNVDLDRCADLSQVARPL